MILGYLHTQSTHAIIPKVLMHHFQKLCIYLATSTSWCMMSSKLWELMRRPQQGRQNISRITELLWRITPTRFMFLLPYVCKIWRIQTRTQSDYIGSKFKPLFDECFAHLRNECVTSQTKSIACWSCGDGNGLRVRESNTRKSENKNCKCKVRL